MFYLINETMRHLIPSILLVAIVLTGFNRSDNNLPKTAWKKIYKEIGALWPELIIEKEAVIVSDEINSVLDNPIQEDQLFKLTHKNELVGYLFINRAPSRYDHFDYMVIYSADLKIKATKILVYRESYGGEIGSKRWLRQFIGLDKKSKMKLGYDIQGISGATISCQSATKGINETTNTITKLADLKAL